MAYHYCFAVLDAMRDDDGQPLLMRDGRPRYGETLTEISPCASTARAVCATLGLTEDLDILRNCPGNAVQIPADALAQARFTYADPQPDGSGGAAINGEAYGEMFDADRIEAFVTLQAAAKRPSARLFLRMD